jgi:hypothetical protein
LGEAPEGAVARCVCPDCTEDTEENGETLDFAHDENGANWSARIFLALFVMTCALLVLEIRIDLVSKLR